MSSREIAQLTGKQHNNVMRDIREMLKGLQKDVLSFESVYLDAKGESRPEFQLPFDETMCLVSGYDVQMRMAGLSRQSRRLLAEALPNCQEWPLPQRGRWLRVAGEAL
jgi:Rha family phage regulatory protein